MTERYFNWLVAQINAPEDRTYIGMFEKMFQKDFVWIVANDNNRIKDAMEVRREFFNEFEPLNSIPLDGANFLEVLIALSRRVASNAGGDQEVWAWTLIENLGLGRMHDPLFPRKERRVNETMENLIWRTYEKDGRGGFFPLEQPKEDQTKVEIWYQMHAYIIERDLI